MYLAESVRKLINQLELLESTQQAELAFADAVENDINRWARNLQQGINNLIEEHIDYLISLAGSPSALFKILNKIHSNYDQSLVGIIAGNMYEFMNNSYDYDMSSTKTKKDGMSNVLDELNNWPNGLDMPDLNDWLYDKVSSSNLKTVDQAIEELEKLSKEYEGMLQQFLFDLSIEELINEPDFITWEEDRAEEDEEDEEDEEEIRPNKSPAEKEEERQKRIKYDQLKSQPGPFRKGFYMSGLTNVQQQEIDDSWEDIVDDLNSGMSPEQLTKEWLNYSGGMTKE
jgi:hypothetical protein